MDLVYKIYARINYFLDNYSINVTESLPKQDCCKLSLLPVFCIELSHGFDPYFLLPVIKVLPNKRMKTIQELNSYCLVGGEE